MDAVSLTQKLLTLNTTTDTDGENEGLRFIAEFFSEYPGYRVSMPLDQEGNPKATVVVPDRPISSALLLMSGHIDVVTAREENWTFSPWSGEIHDGWILGRGASDMKSGLAVQISAMLAAGPTAPIALAVSKQEENSCAGSPQVLEALVEAGICVPSLGQTGLPLSVAAMMVAEPTEGKVILGHKGPLWLTVTTGGKPAHGSMPEAGVSAIQAMVDVISRARTELPLREDWRLGQESLNVGLIEGGTMRNVVPDRCTIKIDMRTVNPDPTPLLEWWQNQPEVIDVAVDSHFAAVWTEPDHPWIRSLPVMPEDLPVAYATEAGTIGAGLNFPPTVIWGPGALEYMHVANERVLISTVEAIEKDYQETARRWVAASAASE